MEEEIDISKDEIEQFFRILLFSGIIQLQHTKASTYRMYWEIASRLSLIADVISRNKFKTILRYAQINDNTKRKPKTDPSNNPLFKVRPLLMSLKVAMSNRI